MTEITQEDRDVAQPFLWALDKQSHSELFQAFANRRKAVEDGMKERAVTVCLDRAAAWSRRSRDYDACTAEILADVIRNLK